VRSEVGSHDGNSLAATDAWSVLTAVRILRVASLKGVGSVVRHAVSIRLVLQ